MLTGMVDPTREQDVGSGHGCWTWFRSGRGPCTATGSPPTANPSATEQRLRRPRTACRGPDLLADRPRRPSPAPAPNSTKGRAVTQRLLTILRPPRSPMASHWDARWDNGQSDCSRTSPPTVPPTGAPKPSTASSNSTAASTEASAIATITAYAACSSPAASPHDTCSSRKGRMSPDPPSEVVPCGAL